MKTEAQAWRETALALAAELEETQRILKMVSDDGEDGAKALYAAHQEIAMLRGELDRIRGGGGVESYRDRELAPECFRGECEKCGNLTCWMRIHKDGKE